MGVLKFSDSFEDISDNILKKIISRLDGYKRVVEKVGSDWKRVSERINLKQFSISEMLKREESFETITESGFSPFKLAIDAIEEENKTVLMWGFENSSYEEKKEIHKRTWEGKKTDFCILTFMVEFNLQDEFFQNCLEKEDLKRTKLSMILCALSRKKNRPRSLFNKRKS